MSNAVWMVLLVGAAGLVMMMPMLRARLAGVKRVAPADVKGRLERGEPLFLLDVRSEAEFADAHIAGAVLAPLDRLGGSLKAIQEDAGGQPVVVVCRMGPRAVTAAKVLERTGFSDVAVLDGGMMGWIASGGATKALRRR
ncbi:MAG TPA: rhodanese-like domain-containing protein [Azospirillum sp.]|nr:rhodanese-like domain-containing protein [Azospirillum sp.]